MNEDFVHKDFHRTLYISSTYPGSPLPSTHPSIHLSIHHPLHEPDHLPLQTFQITIIYTKFSSLLSSTLLSPHLNHHLNPHLQNLLTLNSHQMKRTPALILKIRDTIASPNSSPHSIPFLTMKSRRPEKQNANNPPDLPKKNPNSLARYQRKKPDISLYLVAVSSVGFRFALTKENDC